MAFILYICIVYEFFFGDLISSLAFYIYFYCSQKKKRYLEKLRTPNCSNNLSISLNLLIRNFWKIVQRPWKFGNKFALPSITHLVLDLPRNLRFPEPDKSHKTKVNVFCFSIGLNFKNRSDLLLLHKINNKIKIEAWHERNPPGEKEKLDHQSRSAFNALHFFRSAHSSLSSLSLSLSKN